MSDIVIVENAELDFLWYEPTIITAVDPPFYLRVSYYADQIARILKRIPKTQNSLDSAKVQTQKISTSMYDSLSKSVFSTFDSVKTRDRFASDIGSLQSRLFRETNSAAEFAETLKALRSLILKKSGQTIDEFLTSNSIKVYQLFADACTLIGEVISDSNIKE